MLIHHKFGGGGGTRTCRLKSRLLQAVLWYHHYYHLNLPNHSQHNIVCNVNHEKKNNNNTVNCKNVRFSNQPDYPIVFIIGILIIVSVILDTRQHYVQ